jgi:WD40 repeat protein
VAQVTDIAWEPGGAFAAAASKRGRVYIFSPGGDAILTLEGHEDPAVRVAWSPDGKMLASASEDGTVRLWSVEVGP